MYTDYWRQFLKTGSVQDYLNYRSSISASVKDENNGKSDSKSNGNSNKRDKNQRK